MATTAPVTSPAAKAANVEAVRAALARVSQALQCAGFAGDNAANEALVSDPSCPCSHSNRSAGV
jgi:hypothetical protein